MTNEEVLESLLAEGFELLSAADRVARTYSRCRVPAVEEWKEATKRALENSRRESIRESVNE